MNTVPAPYIVDYSYDDVPTLKRFAKSNKRMRCVMGCFGCLRGDTLIVTEEGLLPISEINRPMRILSWDEKSNQFVLSLSGSAFPKGKDYLYRIVTQLGEFVAKDSHRILSSLGIYLRVDQLKVGDEIASADPDLFSTTSSFSQLRKPLDDPHFSRKGEGSLESYVNEVHQCGQLPLLGEDNGQVFFPLPTVAPQRIQSLVYSDNHMVQEPSRSHSEVCDGHHGKTGSPCQSFSLSDRLVDSFANCNDSLNDKQYSGEAQKGLQSPDTSSFRHNNLLSDSYKTSCDLRLSRILSIERLNVKEEYWDIQVADTNNYVTADGTIHHNSGKSSACVQEIIRRANEQRPSSDGIRRSRWAIVRNTYGMLRDTTIKTFHDWYPPKIFGEYRVTDHVYIITRFPNVHLEIMFRALDRPDQVSNLLSLELTGAWFNEAREIPRTIIEFMDGRINRFPSIRDGGPSWTGIIMDTNPPEEDSYLYKMNEVVRPDNWEVFKQPSGRSIHAENTKHLAKGYYDQLAKGKDEMYIRVYIDGQYGYIITGKPVFQSFVDNVHVSPKVLEPIKGLELLIGMDFGLQPACVLGQVTSMGQLLILDELVSDGMGIRQFCLNQLLPLLRRKYFGMKIVGYGDPSGRSRMQTDESTCYEVLGSREIGLYGIEPAYTNAIVPRIGSVETFLNRMNRGEPSFVLSPNCHYLRKAMNGAYHYEKEPKSLGDEFKPEPVKNFASNIADSLEYLCLFISEKETRDRRNKDRMSKMKAQSAHRPASTLVGY